MYSICIYAHLYWQKIWWGRAAWRTRSLSFLRNVRGEKINCCNCCSYVIIPSDRIICVHVNAPTHKHVGHYRHSCTWCLIITVIFNSLFGTLNRLLCMNLFICFILRLPDTCDNKNIIRLLQKILTRSSLVIPLIMGEKNALISYWLDLHVLIPNDIWYWYLIFVIGFFSSHFRNIVRRKMLFSWSRGSFQSLLTWRGQRLPVHFVSSSVKFLILCLYIYHIFFYNMTKWLLMVPRR